MMTNTDTMTAQIPSAFGMPAYGCAHTVRHTAASAAVVTGENSVLRDREVVIAGGVDLGRATFEGTSAWRPPIC
jgi:hypothetical protein